MATFSKFEDIIAWQKARVLVNDIFTASNDGKFKTDFTLRDQINRCSLSIMLNIAEGFGRKTNKEFIHFLVIAHGSVSELQSALYAACDRKYLSEEKFNGLYNKCIEVSKMIMGLIKHLQSD